MTAEVSSASGEMPCLVQISTEAFANYDITVSAKHFMKAAQFGFDFRPGKQRNNAGFKKLGFRCTFSNCHLSSHLCGLGLEQWRNDGYGKS